MFASIISNLVCFSMSVRNCTHAFQAPCFRALDSFFEFIFNQRIMALQYCVGSAIHQMNQSSGHTHPLPVEPFSHLPPHPITLGCHRAQAELPALYSISH